MKQTSKMWIGMTVLAFASSAVTGAVIKNTSAKEAPAPIFAPSPVAAAVPGGYVDLTSAAESSVNAVVYILYLFIEVFSFLERHVVTNFRTSC